jgi:hypothetical protein
VAAEDEKLTFPEWCKYAREALRQARSEINYAAFFRALSGPVILWVVQLNSEFIKQHQPLVLLLMTLGSAVAVFAIEFLFRLLILAPVKLHKKALISHKDATVNVQNSQEEQTAIHAREKAELQIRSRWTSWSSVRRARRSRLT